MKALVTGAAGFAGSHLIEHLADLQGGPVDGTLRPTVETLPVALGDKLRPHACDITNPDDLDRVLGEVRPTHVFHLAGPAHVGESFAAGAATIQAIAVGTAYLLDAVSGLDPMPRMLLVSSAEVYRAQSEPQTEETPLDPRSPYGVGKLAAEAYARVLARARAVPVVIVRPFNHFGPRQSERFVCSSFARQVAAAELGLGPRQIRTGALDMERDFTDVLDAVRSYPIVLERGEPGTAYNMASGRAWPIRELLQKLIALSKVPLEFKIDPGLGRTNEPARVVGDASRLRALGWEPRIPLEQTLARTLDYWRERLRASAA
jgi:GDP-4-dehydro-6-deoxy-D-mannose reductase